MWIFLYIYITEQIKSFVVSVDVCDAYLTLITDPPRVYYRASRALMHVAANT